MYRLIDISNGEAVMQGRDSAILFARNRDRKAFVERLFAQGTDLHCIGLVSHEPAVLGQMSMQENLGLVQDRYRQPRSFWAAVARARAETGLLAEHALDEPVAALPWRTQVELNFLQAWLLEPQCLVFDRVFDDDNEEAPLHLPALFRARFPLRSICYLQQKGHVPATVQVPHMVEYA